MSQDATVTHQMITRGVKECNCNTTSTGWRERERLAGRQGAHTGSGRTKPGAHREEGWKVVGGLEGEGREVMSKKCGRGRILGKSEDSFLFDRPVCRPVCRPQPNFTIRGEGGRLAPKLKRGKR